MPRMSAVGISDLQTGEDVKCKIDVQSLAA